MNHQTLLRFLINEIALHDGQIESERRQLKKNCFKKFHLKVIKTNSYKFKSLYRCCYTSWGAIETYRYLCIWLTTTKKERQTLKNPQKINKNLRDNLVSAQKA